MAKSYQMLYKCRLCGQVFVNYGTVSEKVAEQSTLNEVLRASGLSTTTPTTSPSIASPNRSKTKRWRCCARPSPAQER